MEDILWLEDLKVTEHYVSKGVRFRWHLVWHFSQPAWCSVVEFPLICGKENIKIDELVFFFQNAAAFSPCRRFFAKSCLCGIIIVMASVHRCWCNRILYCPLYTKYWEKNTSWLLYFYFGLGRRGTVHENVAVVIFTVAKAGVVACRILVQLHSDRSWF